MHWLVDHASYVYFVLALVAIGFFAVFWVNRRVLFLGASLATIAVIAVLWLLAGLVLTDRKQLDRNVNAMAFAVVDQDADKLFQYVARDFRFQQLDRAGLYDRVKRAIKLHNIRDIRISEFEVEELSLAAGTAKASFKAAIRSPDHLELFLVRGDFVRDGDVWKIKGMKMYNPLVNTDQPIEVPLP